jgi:hypothetical protein
MLGGLFGRGKLMTNRWCDTENDLGGEGHYAHHLSFEWIIFRGNPKFWCGYCIQEARELMEKEGEN